MSFVRHSAQGAPSGATGPGGSVVLRNGVLFTNFFLIITALYHLKPASRSLLLAAHGTPSLPYVWIGSALTLLVAVGLYHWILDRAGRLQVVLGTGLLFALVLVGFRLWLATPDPTAPIAFYIFVDIFGVVLVEQFWSLTDSLYSTEEGKRWYGIVGTGGLLGGVAGGGAAALVIRYTPLTTPDLLLVAAGVLGLILGLTAYMARRAMYVHAEAIALRARAQRTWRALTRSRYLGLIAVVLLLAQLVSPLVEYQFLGVIERAYPQTEARTAVLSAFFGVLSAVAIGVNLVVTPLVLRYLGLLGGLLLQPLVLAASTYGFIANASLIPAAAMKISDRGLSYSINRAAKELLYIPVDPMLMYQAKAWIDMFGYRIFKVLGSVLILALTQWSSVVAGYSGLGWAVMGGCAIWVLVLLALHREYRSLAHLTVIEPAAQKQS